MKLNATATFRPRGSGGQFVEAVISPRVVAAVTAAGRLVQATAQQLCPVDTGDLQRSITLEVEETARTIVARVAPHMPYAAYVEFGTGIAGSLSEGAGDDIKYSSTWPGMPAQPYMRPALDACREPVAGIFRGELSLAFRS